MVIELTDEQSLLIPQNVHVRRTIASLLRRIQLCIDVDPDARVKTYPPEKWSRMRESNGIYEIVMARTGVLYDCKWFEGRNCSTWLPGMVDALAEHLIFTCTTCTPGVISRFPRRFKVEGKMVDDIWVVNAGANSPHKVCIEIDDEEITAYLKRVTWNDRVGQIQIMVGHGALKALSMPDDVLGLISQFLDVAQDGVHRITDKDGRRTWTHDRRRASVFPYTLKCTHASHLGRI